MNNRLSEDGVPEKRCTQCEEWKEETLDNFYMINKSTPERGLTPQCKECIKDKAIYRLESIERRYN